MIDEIKLIPWHTLHSHLQDSNRLPSLLSQLLHEQGSALEHIEEIAVAVYDEGTFCTATPYVLPFLLQFLPQAKDEETISILNLLALLARDSQEEIDSNQKGISSSLSLHIHQKLCEGVATYVSLLQKESSQIRSFCAYILSFCTFSESSSVLKQVYAREQDEVVKFVLIMVIKTLHGYQAEEARLIFKSTPLLALKYAFSLALIELLADDLPHEAEMILVESILNNKQFDRFYTVVPYRNSLIEDICNDVVHYMSQQKALALLTQALMSFRIHQPDLELLSLVECQLALVGFVKNGRQEWIKRRKDGTYEVKYQITQQNIALSFTQSQLSQEQQQVLVALIASDTFWAIQTNLLEVYGLPSQKNELARLLQST